MAAILSGTTMYQDGRFLIQNYIFSSKKKNLVHAAPTVTV